MIYAVIVPNSKPGAKEKWQIIEYTNISEAFMTAAELKNTYGIYAADLPKGSKVKHNNWQIEKGQIKVTQKLIRDTFQSNQNVKVIRSDQNKKKFHNGKGAVVKMQRECLEKRAIESLKHVTQLKQELIC